MSRNSENVKKWRKTTKARIVESLGGSCCICGYNKCYDALACHHLDPSKKDLALSAIRANPKNWNTIVLELRKCILVCHNCHCEIHSNLITIPDDVPRFDELYSSYKDLLNSSKEEELNNCPICGTLKHFSKKTCSRSCAAKSQFKVNWDQINLTVEILTKSISQLARELGCSDNAIHKRLKKFN